MMKKCFGCKVDSKYGYHRIPDEEYQKYLGQFRMLLANILQPLRMYGQGVIVDGAMTHIMNLAEEFAMKVRGKQIAYTIPPELIIRGLPDD